MKVIRSLTNDGNIVSPLYATLTDLSNCGTPFYNAEHNLRPPLGICAVSEHRFLSAFLDLVNYINPQLCIDKYRGNNQLFLKTKEVIESLSAYIDDVYLIFKCNFPASAVKKDLTFATRWLEKVGCRESTEFTNAITFASPIILADNHIKHNHGRINTLYMKTFPPGGALGFYVEGISDNETIVPNEEIHPLHNGTATAFSYNRFLLEILSDFFLISYYAERSLKRILKTYRGIDTVSSYVEIDSANIIRILEALFSSLSDILFEDEYEKCPEIQFDGDQLLIKTPADKTYIKHSFHKYTNVNIQMLFSGDGVTRTWKLPYMGK